MVFSAEAEGKMIICQNYKVGAEIDKNINLTFQLILYEWYLHCCVLYLQAWIITIKNLMHCFLTHLLNYPRVEILDERSSLVVLFELSIHQTFLIYLILNVDERISPTNSISSLSDLWIIAFLESIHDKHQKHRLLLITAGKSSL